MHELLGGTIKIIVPEKSLILGGVFVTGQSTMLSFKKEEAEACS